MPNLEKFRFSELAGIRPIESLSRGTAYKQAFPAPADLHGSLLSRKELPTHLPAAHNNRNNRKNMSFLRSVPIFLRQHYLYQVRRVKTVRFTLRPKASPFSYATIPQSSLLYKTNFYDGCNFSRPSGSPFSCPHRITSVPSFTSM